jgi:KaiC/GvpD/RAD55 family RecA-like ATPase
MWFKKLFGQKPRSKGENKDTHEEIQPTEETTKKTTKKEKKPKIDPKILKKTMTEEMKIAKKIAREQLKLSKKMKEDGLASEVKGDFLELNVVGFKKLLKGGGLPIGTSTLVEGGPGSGKTIFCLHAAMDMCRQGKKVLYMSFEEPEDKLIAHMKAFGFNPEKYIEQGTLKIMRFSALDIARSVEALLSEAKKELLISVQPILIPENINPDLVLVDSLTSIASAFSGEESRFRIYMEQLFKYLEEHNMTSLLIREVPNPGHVGGGHVGSDEATSFLSDGIIVFYNVIYSSGERTRAIEILKLRGQDFERKIVEARIINKKGLVIYPHKTLRGKYTLT